MSNDNEDLRAEVVRLREEVDILREHLSAVVDVFRMLDHELKGHLPMLRADFIDNLQTIHLCEDDEKAEVRKAYFRRMFDDVTGTPRAWREARQAEP